MPILDDYITDVLMRDLVGHDRRPVSFLVYLWLAAVQSRSNDEVRLSYNEIAEAVGISKSSAQAAMGWLVRRKLVAVFKRNATAVPSYRALTPWQAAIAIQVPVRKRRAEPHKKLTCAGTPLP